MAVHERLSRETVFLFFIFFFNFLWFHSHMFRLSQSTLCIVLAQHLRCRGGVEAEAAAFVVYADEVVVHRDRGWPVVLSPILIGRNKTKPQGQDWAMTSVNLPHSGKDCLAGCHY